MQDNGDRFHYYCQSTSDRHYVNYFWLLVSTLIIILIVTQDFHCNKLFYLRVIIFTLVDIEQTRTAS